MGVSASAQTPVGTVRPVIGLGRDEPTTEDEPRGAEAGAEAPRGGRRRATSNRLVAAAWALSLLPVVVATARAARRGWLPIGDNAYFAVRARDVFTADPPLLGTWTSASLTTGGDVNNPGPLLFDALSVPTTVLSAGWGIALAVAVLNMAAILGIGLFAHRRGGPLIGLAAAAATAALAWTMGSELLFDPWQPHALLLSFLLFLVVVWSVTCGDLLALPVAAGVGSFILQSHLSYGYLVVVLAVWALVGFVLHLRRAERDDPAARVLRRRATLRSMAAAAVVFALCWSQPLVEELTSEGDGNLTRLVKVLSGGEGETTGLALGTRVVASVLSLPPWWVRPSFGDAFLPPGSVPSVGYIPSGDPDLASSAVALAALTVLGVVLAAAAVVARRRHDLPAALGVATAGVAVVAGLVTAVQMPLGVFGIAPHQFRWLWPLAAFLTFAVVTAVLRRPESPRPRQWAVPALVGLTVVVVVANLPTSRQYVGPSADEWAIPAARAIGSQLGVLEGAGPLLIDVTEIKAFDPYTTAVMAELQRRDIDFVVADEGNVRQLGPARRFTGDNAEAALILRSGDAAGDAPPGTREVARYEPLAAAERGELRRLVADLPGQLGALDELALTDRGRAAVADGDLPSLERAAAGEAVAPDGLLASRELVVMVRAELMELDGALGERLRRYAELQNTADRETVALYLAPLD